MRESVFGTLGDISRLSFLDMFSGSGIIALEAASRGADPVELVEQDRLKRKTLIENTNIAAPQRIQCWFMSAELYVKRAKRSFDIIFCDPPFPYEFKWELLAAIAASPLVKDETLILLHRPREDTPPETLFPLTLEKSKEYGRSVVDFFHIHRENK
jgi:16S rRNA (guanine(966)-N(2))-methyltransferase RsmD